MPNNCHHQRMYDILSKQKIFMAPPNSTTAHPNARPGSTTALVGFFAPTVDSLCQEQRFLTSPTPGPLFLKIPGKIVGSPHTRLCHWSKWWSLLFVHTGLERKNFGIPSGAAVYAALAKDLCVLFGVASWSRSVPANYLFYRCWPRRRVNKKQCGGQFCLLWWIGFKLIQDEPLWHCAPLSEIAMSLLAQL